MSQCDEDPQERAKFEAQVLEGYSIKGRSALEELCIRNAVGNYENIYIQGMWRGWCMKAKDVQTNTTNPA